MALTPDTNLWSTAKHALEYLRRADSIPRRVEGEATLLEFVPQNAARILDLGSGNGRLLGLVQAAHPAACFVALDFSETMLEALRERFSGDANVTIVSHDMSYSLPALGDFDGIISSFAIHHLGHGRKRTLYKEVFDMLKSGGFFLNLEHVASPTVHLHDEFLKKLQVQPGEEDPSNKLLDLETQLGWLREIGFTDVDCHWKWRELALIAATKPKLPIES